LKFAWGIILEKSSYYKKHWIDEGVSLQLCGIYFHNKMVL